MPRRKSPADTRAIRAFSDDDYPQLVALRKAIGPDRATTIEAWRRHDDVLGVRGMEPKRLIAEIGGEVVGYGDVVGIGDIQGADVGVRPEWLRLGIGRALWEGIEALLRERSAAVVRTLWIQEANRAAITFLEHLGFCERERAWDQVLELAELDAAMLPGHADHGAVPGITFTTLAVDGADDERVLRRVHALHNTCRQDQPPPDDHRELIPFDGWVVQMVQGPTALHEAFFLAKADSDYVGMCHLERTGNASVLGNGFTGVLPVCRDRGIARTMKLQAFAYARSHGYRQILTSNHADNGPMRRVNEILGFQKSSGKIRFEKTLTTRPVADERSLRFNRSERDECVRPS